MKIEEKEINEKTLLIWNKTKTDYVLTKTKEYNFDDELRTYEKDLLKVFFWGKSSFTLSKINGIGNALIM